MSKAVQKVEIKEQAPAVAEANALLSMIERAARDPAVDIDKMQRLFLMQQEAEARRARVAFLAAFSALQKELPAIERKGKGHNQAKYARFEDFVEKIKPVLATHGFSLSWRTSQEANVITVTAVLGHEAGHQEQTSLALPADNTGNKNPVQSWGSSIAYGKRYTGMTIIGTATEDEDDDGKKAGAGEAIGQKQEEELQELLVKTNSDLPRFYAYYSKLFRMNIARLSDIPASKFDSVKAYLEDKQSKQKEAKNGAA